MQARPRRRGRAAATVVVLLAAGVVVGPGPAARAHANAAARAGAHPPTPNILILLSDDQAWSTFNRSLMPSVYSNLVDQGVLFDRAYVNTSNCCPSRSEILTGLYQHHTGITGNLTPFDRPTIVDALHDRGYRTMLAGKFLNSMPCDPRPEFDRWACTSVPPSDYSLVDPTINLDGTWIHRTGPTTDILADYVGDFIANTPADRPFFALYSPTSPHLPANDPRYSSMVVPPYRPPSFDQDTRTTTLPSYLRRPPLTSDEKWAIDFKHTVMTRAVRGLDDSVNRILTALGPRANDTLIVYLSDNGYLYGEHRRWEKEVPYEESVRVPMVVRYPPLTPTASRFVSHALVENVDIAPTIAALAGFAWRADGRSFLPLLSRQQASIRQSVLLEECQPTPGFCPGGGPGLGSLVSVPAFWAVVTAGAMYARYRTGDQELYDLQADPDELHNLADTPGAASLQQDLSTKLAFLRTPPPVDTTIVTGPLGAFDARVATFTYFSQSLFATFACRLDANAEAGAWAPCGRHGITYGPLPDGDYVFEVAGTDEYGHTDATPDTRAFSIHTTGPDASILTAPPASGRARTGSFTFSSSTPGATFQCRLVGGDVTGQWQACDSSGTAVGPLADGTYDFLVRADDGTATTDPPADGRFTVDNTGPVWTFDIVPPPVTASTLAWFQFHANEPTPGPVGCSVDGAPPTDCSTGQLVMDGFAEGPHTLAISATDLLGNASMQERTWRVDRTPPVASIESGPPALTGFRSATFTMSSNETGGGFFCTLDVEPRGSCASPLSYRALDDGSHTLVVWARDRAGNVSGPVSWTWMQDSTAPALSGTRARPSTISPNGDGRRDTTRITGTSNEPVAWLLVIKNASGGIVQTRYVATPTLAFDYRWNGRNAFGQLLRNGSYNWFLNANDAVGNTTRTPTATITIKGSAGTAGAGHRPLPGRFRRLLHR